MKIIETYRKYLLSTSGDHTYMWFVGALDSLWDALETRSIPRGVDWLGFEQFSRDVMSADISNDERIELLRSAIGAFTGRGKA